MKFFISLPHQYLIGYIYENFEYFSLEICLFFKMVLDGFRPMFEAQIHNLTAFSTSFHLPFNLSSVRPTTFHYSWSHSLYRLEIIVRGPRLPIPFWFLRIVAVFLLTKILPVVVIIKLGKPAPTSRRKAIIEEETVLIRNELNGGGAGPGVPF